MTRSNGLVPGAPAPHFPSAPDFNNQTSREFARISVEGSQVRLRLSNELGVQPLFIGAVHLAKSDALKLQYLNQSLGLLFGGRGLPVDSSKRLQKASYSPA
jgi:hypothetical protein